MAATPAATPTASRRRAWIFRRSEPTATIHAWRAFSGICIAARRDAFQGELLRSRREATLSRRTTLKIGAPIRAPIIDRAQSPSVRNQPEKKYRAQLQKNKRRGRTCDVIFRGRYTPAALQNSDLMHALWDEIEVALEIRPVLSCFSNLSSFKYKGPKRYLK